MKATAKEGVLESMTTVDLVAMATHLRSNIQDVKSLMEKNPFFDSRPPREMIMTYEALLDGVNGELDKRVFVCFEDEIS